MLTSEDAQAYLAEIGLELPAGIIDALVERTNEVDGCLQSKGYSSATQTLILLHYLGLLAISMGGRQISSQSAPSGASRSYAYQSIVGLHRSLYAGLLAVDTQGCTAGLIPAEPGARAALFVTTGRDGHGHNRL